MKTPVCNAFSQWWLANVVKRHDAAAPHLTGAPFMQSNHAIHLGDFMRTNWYVLLLAAMLFAPSESSAQSLTGNTIKIEADTSQGEYRLPIYFSPDRIFIASFSGGQDGGQGVSVSAKGGCANRKFIWVTKRCVGNVTATSFTYSSSAYQSDGTQHTRLRVQISGSGCQVSVLQKQAHERGFRCRIISGRDMTI